MLVAPQRLYARRLIKVDHARTSFPQGRAHFSTPPSLKRPLRRCLTYARYTGYFALSSVFGLLTLGTGIFVHDAFTYTDQHAERVPRSPLTTMKLGGPKNLPIVHSQVDDEDDEENKKLAHRPKLIIVGGGWGVRPLRVSLVLY